MKKIILMRTAVSTAALLSATTAFADVTAAQVWEDWQQSMAIYGSDSVAIGSETVDGNTLTISDLSMVMEDELSTISTQMGPLVFTENGDGSVSITVPESYLIAVNLDGEVMLDLEVSQDNMVITATGDADAITYDITADSYTMRVADIKGDADDVEGDIFVKANTMSGTYVSGNGTVQNLDYTINTDSVDVLVDVKEAQSDAYFLMSGKMQQVTAQGQLMMPEGVDLDSPEQAFVDGFGFDGGMGYASGEFLLDFNEGGDAATVTLKLGEGGFNGSMDADKFAYDVSADGVEVSAQVPDLPFPVNFSWNVAETGFFMPLSATDAAAQFGFNFALTDVTVSDDIWAMADPAGAVPRDPISIELDLTGMAKLFFDLLDPEQAEAMAFADVPGELETLQLGGLRLSAAGAEVNGTGDFTFDNTDLETFDGLPRPEGALNLNIKGANALIDTAVEIGLLPPDQAGLGRLFMGMFTTPTGDDELTSTIEINDQGHIMANGQRIQ